MDSGAGTKDHTLRGTDRARPASVGRPTRPGRFWRSALITLALAAALLALLATRARAQLGGSVPARSVGTGELLGGLAAVVEARVANLYTARERLGDRKTAQYLPATLGARF